MRLLGDEVGAVAAVSELAARLPLLGVLVVGRELVVARPTGEHVVAGSTVDEHPRRRRRTCDTVVATTASAMNRPRRMPCCNGWRSAL